MTREMRAAKQASGLTIRDSGLLKCRHLVVQLHGSVEKRQSRQRSAASAVRASHEPGYITIACIPCILKCIL